MITLRKAGDEKEKIRSFKSLEHAAYILKEDVLQDIGTKFLLYDEKEKEVSFRDFWTVRQAVNKNRYRSRRIVGRSSQICSKPVVPSTESKLKVSHQWQKNDHSQGVARVTSRADRYRSYVQSQKKRHSVEVKLSAF